MTLNARNSKILKLKLKEGQHGFISQIQACGMSVENMYVSRVEEIKACRCQLEEGEETVLILNHVTT